MRIALLIAVFLVQSLAAQDNPGPMSWGKRPAKFDPFGNLNDQPASLKKKWNFVYPKDALKNRIGGKTTLYVAVDPKGKVRYAEVAETSGNTELDAAALKAIRTAEFRPAQLARKPVSSVLTIPINFNVEEVMATSRQGRETHQLIWKGSDSSTQVLVDSLKLRNGL